MTPDARVQEAVKRAKVWTYTAMTDQERAVKEACAFNEYDLRCWPDGLTMGFACGLLAASAETDRLRSALRHAIQTDHGYRPAACSACEEIQSLLTPTQPR